MFLSYTLEYKKLLEKMLEICLKLNSLECREIDLSDIETKASKKYQENGAKLKASVLKNKNDIINLHI